MTAPTKKTKTKTLCQVLMSREDKPVQDVFWIDNQFAKVGKLVQGEDGIVWRVDEVYGTRSFKDVDRQIRTWAEFAKTLGLIE